jgi:hypothetical protein
MRSGRPEGMAIAAHPPVRGGGPPRGGGVWGGGWGGPANEDYVLRGLSQGVQWLQAGSDFEYLSQFIAPFFQRVRQKAGQRKE